MWSWPLTILPQMTPGPQVPDSGTRRRSEEEPKKWSSWEWWRKLTPSVQYAYILICFSSGSQSCPTLCDPMDYSNARPPCPSIVNSIINSRSLLKLMYIESVMPSNHLILCHPLLLSPSIFPSIRVFFPMSQFFASGGRSIGVSASTSVPSMNIQDWFTLRWTGRNSLHAKRLSRVFSNTTVQKHQFFCAQLCLQSSSHIHTWLLEKP